jgi:hypothetical protein
MFKFFFCSEFYNGGLRFIPLALIALWLVKFLWYVEYDDKREGMGGDFENILDD